MSFRELIFGNPIKPVHVVDMDGVLGNMVKVFCDFTNYHYGTSFTEEGLDVQYDLAAFLAEKVGVTKSDFYAAIQTSGFEHQFEIYEGAADFVEFLKTFDPTEQGRTDFHVALVTSRFNWWPNAFPLVRDTVKDLNFDSIHAIDFKLNKVDWVKNRFENVAAIYEDHPDTLIYAKEQGLPTFRSDWQFNRHVDVPAFCLRTNTREF